MFTRIIKVKNSRANRNALKEKRVAWFLAWMGRLFQSVAPRYQKLPFPASESSLKWRNLYLNPLTYGNELAKHFEKCQTETNWKETIEHHVHSNRQMIFSSSEKRDEVSIEDKSQHQFKLRVSQWFSERAISISYEYFVATGVSDWVFNSEFLSCMRSNS